MSLPGFYKQVERMIENTALQTKTARAIVRKAGLTGTASTQTVLSGRPQTILDAWIVPSETVLQYQWLVDLTGYTYIRFASQSGGIDIALYYSLSTDSTALDPGGWQLFNLETTTEPTNFSAPAGFLAPLGAGASNQNATSTLAWRFIPEALRRQMRVAISYFPSETPTLFQIHPASTGSAFNVALQVL
jgi:hypothetical protein